MVAFEDGASSRGRSNYRPDLRPTAVTLGWLASGAGWLLFAASLLSPAVSGSAFDGSEPVYGWEVFLLSLVVWTRPFGGMGLALLGLGLALGNALFVLSPAFLLCLRRGRCNWYKRAMVAATGIACGGGFSLGFPDLLRGFFLWCGAFIMLTAGTYLLSRQRAHDGTTA
jgi:hypothetical protein